MLAPVGSAKNLGSTCELEINGADELNQAPVVLDSGFKLIMVAKLSAPGEGCGKLDRPTLGGQILAQKRLGPSVRLQDCFRG